MDKPETVSLYVAVVTSWDSDIKINVIECVEKKKTLVAPDAIRAIGYATHIKHAKLPFSSIAPTVSGAAALSEEAAVVCLIDGLRAARDKAKKVTDTYENMIGNASRWCGRPLGKSGGGTHP